VRTTIDLADDILFMAKDFARRDKKTLGQVISDWSRIALKASTSSPSTPPATAQQSDTNQKLWSLGLRTLPKRGGVVTNQMIDQIREKDGI
jgi:hypothetical protein